MWHLTVAGEPVAIPGYVYQGPPGTTLSSSGPDHWSTELAAVISAVRNYEFGAIFLELEGGPCLVFVDKSGLPPLCGHASLGAIHLLAVLGCTRHLTVSTSAGVVDLSSAGPQKTAALFPATGPQDVQASGRSGAFYAECGNRFLLVETTPASLRHPDFLRADASATLHNGEAYGVLYYHILSSTADQITTEGLTIFGTSTQVDLSPCGTGTCALATFLHSSKRLALGMSLINYSLNGQNFTVVLGEQRSGLLRPELSFGGEYTLTRIESAPGALEPAPSWRRVPITEYFK